MPNLLNIHEASEMLNLKVSTLYKMTCQKRVPYVKIGSSLRFRENDLIKWIESKVVMPLQGK